MKKRGRFIIFIVLLALFVLSVVIYLRVNNRKSILSDSICAFPCWHGITLGKTDKQETIEILYTLGSVDKESVRLKQDSRQSFSEWVDFNLYSDVTGNFPSARGSIYFNNDKVARILFMGNTGSNLGDFIETFGEPSYIFVDKPGEASPYFLVFYPLSGIVVGGKVNQINSPITPDNNLDIIQSIAPELFQYLFEKGDLLLFSQMPNFKVYPWKGYGSTIEEYMQ